MYTCHVLHRAKLALGGRCPLHPLPSARTSRAGGMGFLGSRCTAGSLYRMDGHLVRMALWEYEMHACILLP